PVIHVLGSPRSATGETWMERKPCRLVVRAERAKERRNSALSKSLCRQRVPPSEKLLRARPRSIFSKESQSEYLSGEESSSSTFGPSRDPVSPTSRIREMSPRGLAACSPAPEPV